MRSTCRGYSGQQPRHRADKSERSCGRKKPPCQTRSACVLTRTWGQLRRTRGHHVVSGSWAGHHRAIGRHFPVQELFLPSMVNYILVQENYFLVQENYSPATETSYPSPENCFSAIGNYIPVPKLFSPAIELFSRVQERSSRSPMDCSPSHGQASRVHERDSRGHENNSRGHENLPRSPRPGVLPQEPGSHPKTRPS
jgi:hypothetical protein